MKKRLHKAYLVYNNKGQEVAMLKCQSMNAAEREAEAVLNERPFNFLIEETEVFASEKDFGWYEEPR